VGPDGTLEAQISQTPINYQDSSGHWQPINNRLMPTGSAGAFTNAANAYRVRIPRSLGTNPVTFSAAGYTVAERLIGAAATPGKITGPAAQFHDVLPGVSETLTARSAGLNDDLTLQGARARGVFRYRLSLSGGLSAHVHGGVVRFVDAAGRTRVSFLRPFAYDVSHRWRGSEPVRVALGQAAGGAQLTLSADSVWLRRVLAAGDSVVIDPDTSPALSPSQGCTLDQSAPTTSECAASSDNIGWDGAHDHRTLLEFNVQAAVPRDVQVLETRIDATLTAESTATPIAVGAYQVTKPWSTAATWNTTNGSTAWTTAGGDVQTSAADTETVGGTVGAVLHWYPQSLVQQWVNGTAPNDGLELKGTSQSTTNELSVQSADLYFFYQPRGGVYPNSAFTSFGLNDRMTAGVNDSTGDLVLNNQDIAIQGTGLSVVLDRIDGVDTVPSGVAVLFPTPDAPFVYYYDGSGATYLIRKNSNGTFSSQAGLHETLTQNSASQYTMTNAHNGTSEVFQGELGGNFVPTALKDQNANTISFTWNTVDQPSYTDPMQQLQYITDTQGRKLSYSYDLNGNITQVTDSTGRIWEYTPDAKSSVTTYTDPLGNKTTYTYDADENLTQITTPGARITKFAYANEASGDNRVTSVTQVTNNTTGAGDTTSFAYSSTPSGPCLSTDFTETIVTDPLGHKTTYCDNPLDAVRAAYDPLGHQHTSTYDVDGNVTQFAAGTGATISKATYDINDDRLSATDATNVSSTAVFGDSTHPDYPTSETDGQGSKISYAYYSSGQTGAGTGGGNLKTITDNSDTSPIYTFTYNPNGTVATDKDQAGNTTTYSYDAKGNLTKITPATASNPTGISQLGATSYTSDALSRLSSMTDGNGKTTSYTYDALDRLTQIKYADLSTVTFTYDPDGNLTKRVDSAGVAGQGTGTESWTYDQKNRITKITLPGGQTSSYAYDAANNLTSLTDSTGTTTYGYNAANLLTSLAVPGGSCASNPTSGCGTFAYDANGNRTTTNLPNGVTESETSDGDGHVLTLQATNSSGTVLTKYAYSYALGGSLTDLVQTATDKDGNSTTYTYDTRDRLIKAVTTGPAAATDSYGYDANNNRVSSTDLGGTYTWAYNADNQLCWKATGTLGSASCSSAPSGATAYTYDADGNETGASNSWTATYNDRNQLGSFTLQGGSTATEAYGGPGQDELTADSPYTYENNLLGPGIQHGGQFGDEDYVREPDGQLFSTNSDGQRTYPLFDGEGSLADISNSTGGSDGYFTYDPFGRPLTAVGQDFNNEFGWQGGQVAAGFWHFGARYYINSQGRFTQPDPESHPSDPTQYNPYVFGSDDPVNESDPDGTRAIHPRIGLHGGTDFGQLVDDALSCIEGADDFKEGGPIGKVAGCALNRFNEDLEEGVKEGADETFNDAEEAAEIAAEDGA
jgi:RHS repeat-associated protein